MGPNGGPTPRRTGRLTVGRKITGTWTLKRKRVILQGTGFPFRRLLWLAGLRWKYPKSFPRDHPVPGGYTYGHLALQVRGGGLTPGSKIWSSVLWNLDTRVVALARPRSNYTSKLQTHLLVREGDQIVKPTIVRQKKKIWSWVPDASLTDWPSVVNELRLEKEPGPVLRRVRIPPP
jgi:hypothetical protein